MAEDEGAVDNPSRRGETRLALPPTQDSSSDDGDDRSASSAPHDESTMAQKSPPFLKRRKLDENEGDESNILDREPELTNRSDNETGCPKASQGIEVEETSTSSMSATTWHGFSRKTSHLKALVQKSISDARITLSQQSSVSVASLDGKEASSNRNGGKVAAAMTIQTFHAAEIARKKTAECMLVGKKLQDADARTATLEASNESLRNSITSTNDRLERTKHYAKIVQENCVKARAHADQAEALASSLAKELETLRSLVEDTTRRTEVVQQDQDQIQAATRSMESTLLQKQLDLDRCKQDQRDCKVKTEEACDKVERLETDSKNKQEQIDLLTEELRKARQSAKDKDLFMAGRKRRHEDIEKELRESRSVLTESSAAIVQANAAAGQLQSAVSKLREENQSAHTALNELQQKIRASREENSTEQANAEKEIQKLRIDAVNQEEDMRRLETAKKSLEGKYGKLKVRVAKWEKQSMAGSTNLASSSSMRATSTPTPTHFKGSTDSNTRLLPSLKSRPNKSATAVTPSFSIPALVSVGKSTSRKKSPYLLSNPSNGKTCCICKQRATGHMRACGCGKCDKRAHVVCMNKAEKVTSSSKGPIILCGPPIGDN